MTPAAPPISPPGAGAHAQALIQEARRRQRRRYLVTGLAIVLLAASAGVSAGVSAGAIWPGSSPSARELFPPPGVGRGAPARYSAPAPYYAYTVGGTLFSYVTHGMQYGASVDGRYLKIRATGTGRLLARISPPEPCNSFRLLTSNADGRLFVFGAMRYWHRGGRSWSWIGQRDRRTPMTFLALRIAAGGHLQMAALSLPESLTPGQHPSIALSPDGSRLAVAFGGSGQTAVVQVITLATGQVRQWTLPRPPWTPWLSRSGAWTSDGRILTILQAAFPRFGSAVARLRYRPPLATRVLLLDTAAPGASLTSARLLVLRPPAGKTAPGRLIITPDGSKLIGSVESPQPRANPWTAPLTGQLAVYSTRTGALLRTLASWQSRTEFGPTETVAWSNRNGSQLIILRPSGRLNILGVLTAQGFTASASQLLPRQPSGYQELQLVLRGHDAGISTTW